ncbi:MAG TPA: hypothetical protein PKK18_01560 [Chitinophagales bacterium]|nr:hypothetical protein [Chitinophagales bacterium]HMX59431.1 hypothetical protein [Chitinophagales bacterium]HMY22438.1 hypothetical protein [Chitinophagales bacterium]HNC70730.1 hypothetical protein [Chitinophagales bacterium]HND82852.1 hypothetical protein [Chitinophagales bacterium]
MKGVFILIAVILLSIFTTDSFAKCKKYKKSKSSSNIYVSKKYKGHSCPKPRKIINAVYF